jgi:hypothetical protein
MPNCEKGRTGMGGYHQVNGREHHLFAECRVGEAIPDENCRPGPGGLPRCSICQNMADAKAEERSRRYYQGNG